MIMILWERYYGYLSIRYPVHCVIFFRKIKKNIFFLKKKTPFTISGLASSRTSIHCNNHHDQTTRSHPPPEPRTLGLKPAQSTHYWGVNPASGCYRRGHRIASNCCSWTDDSEHSNVSTWETTKSTRVLRLLLFQYQPIKKGEKKISSSEILSIQLKKKHKVWQQFEKFTRS